MYPRLRADLSEKRLLHSLLVAATARRLAHSHRLSEEPCELAGLVHDCAKCLPLQTQQRIARENRLLLDKETLANENMLHGPVGAALAETEYGIHDPNVLSAIRCHTTGRVGMRLLIILLRMVRMEKPAPTKTTTRMISSSRENSRENIL